MALSIIDRLLGRPEYAEAKAATGPGAFAMTYHPPWQSLSRDPNKLMAEAQGLFHSNGWVAAAERALGGRFVRMDWHLENADGDTIDDTSPENEQAVLRLLERPTTKTRSKLWGVTFRHLGLCGNAFWYLAPAIDNGEPLDLVYINPARMTPVTDAAGNVKGWVLDHPDNQAVNARTSNLSRTGVPLTTEEVIHFTMDEPDWGVWGVGIAESAQRKIELDRLTDMHAGGVLASGGRLSGLVSPKTGIAVNDDQWTQFVRDWRSITSDPDAAKRLQIAKMPLDFTQMTASPKDLQLMDVSKQGRNDILGLWGVPESELGIAVAAGLNSDLSSAYKETIWETVKQRALPIRESIQYELLDRFGALGVDLNLVFDFPEFDDDTSQYESAEKSVNVALTNNERRTILGLDPLEDEELGNAIWISSSLTRIDVEPEPVVVQAPMPNPTSNATPEEEDVVEGKANLTTERLRARMEAIFEPRLRRIIERVLGEQDKLVQSKAEHAARKNDYSWWNAARENKRFTDALEPELATLAENVAREAGKLVAKPAKATIVETVIDALRDSIGARIMGINQTTLDRVKAGVAAGMAAGEGPRDIAARLRPPFDEARAELISRTETMLVYNEAALRSYAAYDVGTVQAIDGDKDEECSARDGNTYSVDDALNITDHPHGTLDWIPLKAALDAPPYRRGEEEKDMTPSELKAVLEAIASQQHIINNYLPDQAPPVVNVTTDAKADVPQEVIVTQMPSRAHRALRDSAGKVVGSFEEDA